MSDLTPCNQMQPILSDQQHQAIEMLASGKKISCIAQTLDIRRETLWRWRQQADFQYHLDKERQTRAEQMQAQFGELLRLSFAAITRELALADNPQMRNPLPTALQLLKLLPLTAMLPPARDLRR